MKLSRLLALVLGCGLAACDPPAQGPAAPPPSAPTSMATAATPPRPSGGPPRELFVLPPGTPFEFHPLEGALIAARIVPEERPGELIPRLELHLFGASNVPPRAALHAGLPAASDPAYVHERVQMFVGRWPDAAYALVLDDPGNRDELAKLLPFEWAPAQLYRWMGDRWSPAGAFPNVRHVVSVGGGLLATKSLLRGPDGDLTSMFGGYEFASAFGPNARKPAPAEPAGFLVAGRPATRLYGPAIGTFTLLRPRLTDAPPLVATPSGDVFVAGCAIPPWVEQVVTKPGTHFAIETITEQPCRSLLIEHFRPGAERSTVHSIDSAGARFPLAIAARAANDAYVLARGTDDATNLFHYNGAQWVPEDLPADLRSARAMTLTPRALWLIALRGEPGRTREPNDLTLWRMDRQGGATTWTAVSLPPDAKPSALAAVGSSVWVSATLMNGHGGLDALYELSE